MRSPALFSIAYFLATTSLCASSALAPKVVERVGKSCVEVLVDGQLRGGGAIVETSGEGNYVVTAAHLFPRPNAYITILTEDYGLFTANLIAYDFGHDLALLELNTKRALPALEVATYTPSPTQPVFNFGPALKRRTLIISGTMASSRINYTDFEPSDGYIAHTFIAAINPVFTSGGVWVNQEGEIIGVQSGRLKGDAGAPSSGLSMACPPSAIRRIAQQKTSASTPGIGAWVWELWNMDRELLDQLPAGMQGLAVRWVRDKGPLSRAGVRSEEILLSCDGKPLVRRNDLFSVLRSKSSGTSFRIRVYSPGSKRTRDVTLVTEPLETRWNVYLQKLRQG